MLNLIVGSRETYVVFGVASNGNIVTEISEVKELLKTAIVQ